MAKRRAVIVGALEVLLALKTELWQSHTPGKVVTVNVLLALKTELWQSAADEKRKAERVLLALKTELWQSLYNNADERYQYCSP